jgi:L-ascorbate metabolism protein UlaG (beta-lactamase superfamily)
MRRLAVLTLLVLGGCAGSIANLDVKDDLVPRFCCRDENDAPVEFEYLGSGGWMVRRGDDAVMTAPFFSNPSLFRTLFLPVRPARELIREEMRTVAGREHVRVMLAGHAHYDHLLDVETALEELSTEARVYGGTTVAALVPRRGVDVTAQAGTMRARGEWIQRGRIRFLPIFSEHAAHVMGIKAANGHYTQPPAKLPRLARDWREGETLAFLIDLLNDDGSIDLRIYYDDAAHNSPYGYVDAETLREREVDVAILCVASFHEVEDYPRKLLGLLRPGHVLLGHWEDFFLPYEVEERTVRLTNVREFIDELPPGTAWTMLRRRGIVRLVP